MNVSDDIAEIEETGQAKRKRRILFVAMANSIHTFRWMDQLDHEKDDIFLFSSNSFLRHPSFKNRPKIYGFLPPWPQARGGVYQITPFRKLSGFFQMILDRVFPDQWRGFWLSLVIRFLKPDIIHSLEFQHAGYMCSVSYTHLTLPTILLV